MDKDYKEISNLKVLKNLINDDKNNRTNDLNKFAWDIAIDENANNELQLIGKLALEKAFKQKDLTKDVENALNDTLASINFRLGNNLDALTTENSLFINATEINDKEFYASQIIRFSSFANKSIGIVGNDIFTLDSKAIKKIQSRKYDCLSYSGKPHHNIVVQYFPKCADSLLESNTNQIIFFNLNLSKKSYHDKYNFDRRVSFFPFYQ